MQNRELFPACRTLALAALALAMPAHALRAETTLGSVRVAGVSVKGLTPVQARQKLAQNLKSKLNARLRITDGLHPITKTRAELGVVLDVERMVGQAKQGAHTVPLALKVNRSLFQKALRNVAARMNTPGKSAFPAYQNGRVRIDRGQDRRLVDVGKSAQTLADLIEKKPQIGTLRLVVVKKPPQVSASTLAGVNARLSRFTTLFNAGSAKRAHNIRVAVKNINGTVIRPGEVFSINAAARERTHKNGYLTANVLENKQRADGIGGGVSQVTGTLFNAALLAGLKIVEYAPHSRPVAYLPVGRDATVVWGVSDLKIKNDTHAPIYIDTRVVNNRCIATLYGAARPGVSVRLAVHKQKPAPTHVITDLYRIVTKNGKQVAKEKIGHADYDWHPEKSRE